MTVVATPPSHNWTSTRPESPALVDDAPVVRRQRSQPSAVTVNFHPRGIDGWNSLAAQTGPLWTEWLRLWESLSGNERDPSTHPGWQSAWLARHLTSDRDICVAECRASGKLLAVLPLEIVRSQSRLQSGWMLTVPDEIPLEGASAALPCKHVPQLLNALLRTPIEDGRTASMIEFARVDTGHCLLSRRGLSYRVEQSGSRSVIDLPEDNAALWEGLGSNLRGNLRKARNKWQKYADARIDELTDEAGLSAALSRLGEVEARSWKADEGTDLTSDTQIREFFAAAMPVLAAERRAVAHVLVADGRDIGAHLSLRFGDELLVHKISFDAHYSDCAPGNLLLQHLLDDYAPRAGLRRINLVTSLPWHQRWKPQQQPTYRVQVFRPGLRGLWTLACSVPSRDRLRNWLSRTGLLSTLRSWRDRRRMSNSTSPNPES